jgi:hypothetical protein
MSWLFGAALLPFLLCGAMCLGGMLLAALGLRRGTRNESHAPRHETQAARPSATADR